VLEGIDMFTSNPAYGSFQVIGILFLDAAEVTTLYEKFVGQCEDLGMEVEPRC
jgi:hypothetical protein